MTFHPSVPFPFRVFAQFDQINPPRSNCPAYAKVLAQKDTTEGRLDTFTVASITHILFFKIRVHQRLKL
jgi:hypothetical protein